MGCVTCYGLMWQGNECEAAIKALVIGCEKVKGLRVLSMKGYKIIFGSFVVYGGVRSCVELFLGCD